MIITVDAAIKILPVLAQLVLKLVGVVKSGNPTSIDEELKALDECNLRPSSEIIEEADKVTRE